MTTAILLSGGYDSTALAYWKKPSVAFTIDYGQVVAEAEIRSSAQICKELHIQHDLIRVDCRALGSGDLAATLPSRLAPASEWWPFRNQLLISLAAMKSIHLGITQLLFGTVKSDRFHADGRREFFDTMNNLLLVQEGSVQVDAPALDMSSADLIKRSGIEPGILAWAHSCHVSNYACGKCRGCYKHREVTAELGYEPY